MTERLLRNKGRGPSNCVPAGSRDETGGKRGAAGGPLICTRDSDYVLSTY